MPPKKATSRKAATKMASSSAGAEVLNNGEKDVKEIATDAKNLANGSSLDDESISAVSSILKATKRTGGRAKNVAKELEAEVPFSKKPVAKGRSKKKLSESEVIENEDNSTQADIEEVEEPNANDVKTKPKGRGGGKKVEVNTKKASKAKEVDKEAALAESVPEEHADQVEEVKHSENNKKVVSGRKKKEEVQAKAEPQIEVKEDIVEEEVKEKDFRKQSRNSKKAEETTTVVEPQKKKGRIAKKEKSDTDLSLAVTESDEIKADVKEKKPVKRGRATAAKAVIETEETLTINGDSEEVLPKKRSRKAVSVEKEIVKDKPKRGRAKKADEGKTEDADLKEKQTQNASNKQIEQENAEEIEELENLNKEEETQLEPAVEAPKEAGKAKGRKRAAPSAKNKKTSKATADNGVELDGGIENAELEDEADGSKSSKAKKGKTDTALLNSTVTKYNKEDFDLKAPVDGETVEEPRFNFKISSWNVAGLRSWIKKDGLKFLDYEQPDIFCMQETKCTNDQLPEDVTPIPGYHPYWLCMPGGYAGVAIYSKIMPINVEYGIGNKEFDDCGRIITAEYEKFFLVNVYVPNSGRKLVNLEARMKWEKLFQQFIQNLDSRKPVVICGDMNVSHQEIDLANPKSNTRSAGFTKEERDKMTELLALGYIDTFRHFYPELKGAYTYWTYMANARSRNVGWRLDYFIVSERFIKRVVDNCIRSQCMGSDHCPITLFLKL